MPHFITTRVTTICDKPGCYRQITAEDKIAECGHGIDIEKKKKAGWEFYEYYDETDCQRGVHLSSPPYNYLAFCPTCKNKDFLANPLKRNHDCAFILTDKNGKPDPRGKLLVCFFCGRLWPEKIT